MKNPNRALRLRDAHTVTQVFRRLRRVLEREGLIDEYFSLATPPAYRNVRLSAFMRQNRYTWFACYAVTGGSEGHYIHVDIATQYDVDNSCKVFHLITGKTFLGMEHALKIAARCSQLLGA